MSQKLKKILPSFTWDRITFKNPFDICKGFFYFFNQICFFSALKICLSPTQPWWKTCLQKNKVYASVMPEQSPMCISLKHKLNARSWITYILLVWEWWFFCSQQTLQTRLVLKCNNTAAEGLRSKLSERKMEPGMMKRTNFKGFFTVDRRWGFNITRFLHSQAAHNHALLDHNYSSREGDGKQ